MIKFNITDLIDFQYLSCEKYHNEKIKILQIIAKYYTSYTINDIYKTLKNSYKTKRIVPNNMY